MVCKWIKEKGWKKRWWDNKCQDRVAVSCFTRINAWKEKGCCSLSAGSLLTLPVEFFTDPFTPLLAHLPDSTRIANISTLQGDLRKDRAGRDGQRMGPSAAGLPICLIVPGPSLQKSLLTCSFRKQSLFIMSQALHSELLLSSCQERRATVQGYGELSGVHLGWSGQGKLWAGSFSCPNPFRQWGCRGLARLKWDHQELILKFMDSIYGLNCVCVCVCVFAFMCPCLCEVSLDCQPGC
jgi:hypothetical protein